MNCENYGTMKNNKKICITTVLSILGFSSLLGEEVSVEAPQFDTIPEFYQVISGQLNSLNPRNGAYTKIGNKIESYNAAGYNVLDGYAYGWGRFAPFKDQLIRIHGDNSFESLGKPRAVGAESPTLSLYAGDMDDEGNLWVRGDKMKSPALMKINVASNTYEMVPFLGPDPGAVADLVYQKKEGKAYFFGCRNQSLYLWDVSTQQVTRKDVANLPPGRRIYGAAYTDKGGNLYVSDNEGGVYQILNYQTDSPRAVFLIASVKTGNNDGFSNPNYDSPIIIPENQAPSIVVEDEQIRYTNKGIEIDASVEDEGLPFEGDGLVVKWTQGSGPGDIRFSSPDRAKSELSFSRDGEYIASLEAGDGELITDVHFQIQVRDGEVKSVQTTASVSGDYTYSRQQWAAVKEQLNCRSSGMALALSKRGFHEDEYKLTEDSEVIVTAIYDGGSFRNRLFWYDALSPVTEHTVWEQFVIGPTAPLKVGSRTSLGVLPAGTQLRFGLQVDAVLGGMQRVYQDTLLNPSGSTQVAARLFDRDEYQPMILAFEDQIDGDEDFNDVILQITIIPRNLGITQLDEVIEGQEGLHSNRGRRGVRAHAESLQLYAQHYENIHQVWKMPDEELIIHFEEDRSSMKFDFLVFDYNEVRHLPPASLEFRKRAVSKGISILDDRLYNPGNEVRFDPADYHLENKDVGFLIIPNNKKSVFLRNPWRYSPRGNGNRTKRQPLFSVNNANPGGHDQFLTFQKDRVTMFAIEDYSRELLSENEENGNLSNHVFDNIIISITGNLVGKNIAGAGLTTDVTAGWDGEDGIPLRDGVKCY